MDDSIASRINATLSVDRRGPSLKRRGPPILPGGPPLPFYKSESNGYRASENAGSHVSMAFDGSVVNQPAAGPGLVVIPALLGLFRVRKNLHKN